MNKIYTVPKLQSVLPPIFHANGMRKATLFGSYAKGMAMALSDMDLPKLLEELQNIQAEN